MADTYVAVDNLLAEGYTQAEIARILGISRQAVNQLLNKDKRRARGTTYRLTKINKNKVIVKPQLCEDCGSSGELEGHHEDYTSPEVVVWLCLGCHNARRKKILPHGTTQQYWRGCRCRSCVSVTSAYRKALRHKKLIESGATMPYLYL